jgi:hypothetical protein
MSTPSACSASASLVQQVGKRHWPLGAVAVERSYGWCPQSIIGPGMGRLRWCGRAGCSLSLVHQPLEFEDVPPRHQWWQRLLANAIFTLCSKCLQPAPENREQGVDATLLARRRRSRQACLRLDPQQRRVRLRLRRSAPSAFHCGQVCWFQTAQAGLGRLPASAVLKKTWRS